MIAHVGLHIVENRRVPHAAGVMQHSLVVERQIGGAHDAAPTGHTHALCGWVVETHQRCRRDLGDGEFADAERGHQLVGRGLFADQHQLGRRIRHVAQQAPESRRCRDAILHHIAIVATCHSFDDLG